MRTAIDFLVINLLLGIFSYAVASFSLSYSLNLSFFKIYSFSLILLLIAIFYFLIKLDFSSEDQNKSVIITLIVGIAIPITLFLSGAFIEFLNLYFHNINKGIFIALGIGTAVINLLASVGIIVYTQDESIKGWRRIYFPEKLEITVFLLSLTPFAILDDILFYFYLTRQINFQIENQGLALLVLFMLLIFFGIQINLASKLSNFLLKRSGGREE
jgi:hypothetical protein